MELVACSGPGAIEAIVANINTGFIHAVLAGALLVVSLVLWRFVSGQWGYPAILAILVLLHPAWTVSALRGDCGFLKRDVSWAVTAAACFLVLAQIMFSVRGQDEPTLEAEPRDCQSADSVEGS